MAILNISWKNSSFTNAYTIGLLIISVVFGIVKLTEGYIRLIRRYNTKSDDIVIYDVVSNKINILSCTNIIKKSYIVPPKIIVSIILICIIFVLVMSSCILFYRISLVDRSITSFILHGMLMVFIMSLSLQFLFLFCVYSILSIYLNYFKKCIGLRYFVEQNDDGFYIYICKLNKESFIESNNVIKICLTIIKKILTVIEMSILLFAATNCITKL